MHRPVTDRVQSLNFVYKSFSEDVGTLLRFLFTPGRIKSVVGLMPMIGVRFFGDIDTRIRRDVPGSHAMFMLRRQNDVYEDELSKELGNGRLFRLLARRHAAFASIPPAVSASWSL